MSRLIKYAQRLFAQGAGAGQIAKFGSLSAGSPQTYSGSTITPELIQQSLFPQGWFAAVVGQNSPAIEDMNALCYLFAYQLAYLFQAGIPEWDNSSTYYTGNYVQQSSILYTAQVDTPSLPPPGFSGPTSAYDNWFTPIQAGVLTPNSFLYSTGNFNVTLPANQTLMWPNLILGTNQSTIVPSSACLIGVNSIQVTGGGTFLRATGSGIIRVL